MKKIIKTYNRELSVVVALILLLVIFGTINPIYVSPSNLVDIINQATIYGMMGLGMTFIIISGGIDLSVGSAFALVGVVVAKLAVAGVPAVLVILIGLALGFLLGCVNGFLISKLSLQPFVATMGTMSIFRGIAYVVTDGKPVLSVPKTFRRTVDGLIIGDIRISIIIFLVAAVILGILLKETEFGNSVYAIGGNEEAARLSGIKTTLNKVFIYGVGMMGTAMAAIIQIGKLGTGEASAGQGYELDAIAAVAIGGASMAGGRGGILGTVLGAILFAGLKVGLITAGVETFYQYIATGLVIVVAACIEIVQAKITEKTNLKNVKRVK